MSKSRGSWLLTWFFSHSLMTGRDKTLNDLTYLLDDAKSAVIWSISKANWIGRSTFQTYLDIENGDIGGPGKTFSSQWKGIGHSQLG